MKALVIKANDAIVPNSTQRTALTDRQVYVFDVRSLAEKYTAGSKLTSGFTPNVISSTSDRAISIFNAANYYPIFNYTSNDGTFLDFSAAAGEIAYLRSLRLADNSGHANDPIFVVAKFKITDWSSPVLVDFAGSIVSSNRIFSTGTTVTGGKATVRAIQFKNGIQFTAGLEATPGYFLEKTDDWITVAIFASAAGDSSKIIHSKIDKLKEFKTGRLSANIDSISLNSPSNETAVQFTPKMLFKYLGVYRGNFSDIEIKTIFEYVKTI